MEKFVYIFEGIVDPRRSNATFHDLDGMLMIDLPSALYNDEDCADMERSGWAKERFLRGFRCLAYSIPSHDAFTKLFNALDSGGLQRAMMRLADG